MSKNNLISVHFATFYLQIETTMVASRFHGFRFHGFRFQVVRLRMVDELNCQMEVNKAEESN